MRAAVGNTDGVTLLRTLATFPHMGSVPKAAALMSLVAVQPGPVDTCPGVDPPVPSPSPTRHPRSTTCGATPCRRAPSCDGRGGACTPRRSSSWAGGRQLLGAGAVRAPAAGAPRRRRRARHRPRRRRHVDHARRQPRLVLDPPLGEPRPGVHVRRCSARRRGCGGSSTTRCTTATPTSSGSTPTSPSLRSPGSRRRSRGTAGTGRSTSTSGRCTGSWPSRTCSSATSSRSITGRLDQQPLRQRVRPRVVAQITAGKLAHLGVGGGDPAAVQPVVGRARLLPGVLVARRLRARHHVPAGPLRGRHDHPRRRRRRRAAAPTSRPTSWPRPPTWPPRRRCSAPSPAGSSGGLDHQIEHHLAPRAAAHRVPGRRRPVPPGRASDHGIAYRLHPGVWSALCSHTRWLRAMSVATP